MNAKLLYIRTNTSCNSRCFMCNFWKNTKDSITKEQFEVIMKKTDGVKLVRFTGGEPLLCDKLPHFIQYCHNNHITTSVITNGLILNEKIDDLIANGLDQIIVSVDGSHSELHDELRGIAGLFNIIENTINRIRDEYPQLCIRVNTVVSAANILDLPQLSLWLDKHCINQWSIIPIKLSGYHWREKMTLSSFRNAYESFQSSIRNCAVELLGYSSNWVKNIDDFWEEKEFIRPQGPCYLSQMVAFYDPFSNHIFPCNCLPHRSDNNHRDSFWYFKYGNVYCEGCEPVNAWIADHPNEFENDILKI